MKQPPPSARLLLNLAAGSRRDSLLTDLDHRTATCLVDLASEFRLSPLLNAHLASIDLDLPNEAAALLHEDMQVLSQRWLSQQSQLRALAQFFAGHEITFVALKGVPLALQYYSDPLLRPMRDLDLLMRESDAGAAYDLLLANGFQNLPDVISRPVGSSHQFPALRSPSGVLVEVHIDLISDWTHEKSLSDRIMRSERRATCLGVPIKVPEWCDLGLHLIAHATMNRPFDVGPQVLADLTAMGLGARELKARLLPAAAKFGLERAVQLFIAIFNALEKPNDEGIDLQELVDESITLMLASPETERDRKLLMRTGGAQPGLRAVAKQLLHPNPVALAGFLDSKDTLFRQSRAYARWLTDRVGRYRAARRRPGMVDEIERVETLSRWLRG